MIGVRIGFVIPLMQQEPIREQTKSRCSGSELVGSRILVQLRSGCIKQTSDIFQHRLTLADNDDAAD